MSKLLRTVLIAIALLIALSAISCTFPEDNAETSSDVDTTVETSASLEYNTTQFNNPISYSDAPDPFITYDAETGYYYALHTQGDRIEIYRHKHAAEVIIEGETKVIYRATGENAVWGDIWAPEMHRGPDGLWYIYTSSRITKDPGEKRIFVLGSLSSDPFGEWEFKGRPAYDIFSIDPTVYTAPDGTQYMCYSRVDPQKGQVLECRLHHIYLLGGVAQIAESLKVPELCKNFRLCKLLVIFILRELIIPFLLILLFVV